MINFPGQFYAYRKTVLGDNLITLRVDSIYSKMVMELVETDIGTEFNVLLEDVIKKERADANKDVKERFFGQFHSKIAELADLLNISPEECKKKIKEELRELKMIEVSTKELDIKGLAIACNIIDNLIKKQDANQPDKSI